MAILAKPAGGRFDAKMVAEAEALGRAAARIRPVGRRPRDAQTGAHGRRRAGPGSAFWQYRTYNPGESVRNIDWRRSARGDAPIVREREWEAALTLDIWVDSSRSMDFPAPPDPLAKRHVADMLALSAASAWLENAERVRVLNDPRPANASGIGKIGSVVAALARAAANPWAAGQDDLPPRGPAPRQGFVLLIGDFLTPTADLAERAATLAGRGARGAAIQVLHPHEVELPAKGRVEFASVESGESHLLRNVELGRDVYRQRMADHTAALNAALARFGWGFVQHRTDAPLTPTLARALAMLAATGG
jgi:uncharacterized protein (DUF58 family)